MNFNLQYKHFHKIKLDCDLNKFMNISDIAFG